jgi:hypothetical protein
VGTDAVRTERSSVVVTRRSFRGVERERWEEAPSRA